MLFAVIDLGSNSFKMTVAQYVGVNKKIPFKIIHKERHPVQFGGSVFETKNISKRHHSLGLKALHSMKSNLTRFNMPLVKIVGTSAIREAKNGNLFIKDVLNKLNLPIQVISGIEEAKIIAQGLEWEYPFVEKGLLVDIGGGSTEVAPFGKGWSKNSFRESFRMGSVRLALGWENAAKNPKSIAALRRKARKVFCSQRAPTQYDYLVGTAGAIQSLGIILSNKKKDSVIHRDDLDLWIESNYTEDHKTLQAQYNLAPSRARVLIPGAVILSEALGWLNEEDIFVTEMTLRNGLLVGFVEEIKKLHWLIEEN